MRRINKEAGNASRSLLKYMTTRQSTGLVVHDEVKRGTTNPVPKAPLNCGGEAPANGPELFTQGIQTTAIALRQPTADDAARLHQLIADCPPLDPNSLYCNLLHCTHFSATSVAAVRSNPQGEERLVGFISAYIPPQQPDTLFVWQVAVAQEARGEGLARRMLDNLVARPACKNVRYIDTTITPGNQASWGMFESWARHRGAPTSSQVHFERERHFAGQHDDEHLMRIGPFEIAAEFAT